jgi:hypothetical protein
MNASKADKHPPAHSAGDTAHARSTGCAAGCHSSVKVTNHSELHCMLVQVIALDIAQLQNVREEFSTWWFLPGVSIARWHLCNPLVWIGSRPSGPEDCAVSVYCSICIRAAVDTFIRLSGEPFLSARPTCSSGTEQPDRSSGRLQVTFALTGCRPTVELLTFSSTCLYMAA